MADPATVAGAAAEHGSGGLPQFDLELWPGQMVWMLIIFLVMFILFAKVFVPKVGGAIEGREGQIAGDIAEARRLKDEAEAQAAAAAAETAEARARAQRIAAEAKAKAQAEAAKRQAAEEAKLNEKLAAAEASLAVARDKAMAKVAASPAKRPRPSSRKLTGQALDTAEVKAALPA